MSFRLRLTVLTSLAVAVAIVGASFSRLFHRSGRADRSDRHQPARKARPRRTPGGPDPVQPVQLQCADPSEARARKDGDAEGLAPTGSSATTHALAAEKASVRRAGIGARWKSGPSGTRGEGLAAERVPNKGDKNGREGRVRRNGRSPSGPGPASAVARLVLPGQQLGIAPGYVQLVERDGHDPALGRRHGGPALPVTAATRAVAGRQARRVLQRRDGLGYAPARADRARV